MSQSSSSHHWVENSNPNETDNSTKTVKAVCLRPRQKSDSTSQKTTSEPGWKIMPMAYRLGIPIAFSASTLTQETDINDIATMLSIDADFERNDDDILANGFDTTIKGDVSGPVDIMRVDGKNLLYQDIECLRDYVAGRFPYMRRLCLGNRTVVRVGLAREEWKDYGNPEMFAEYWRLWRLEALRAAREGYEALQCPVVLTPMPSITEASTTGIQALQEIIDGQGWRIEGTVVQL